MSERQPGPVTPVPQQPATASPQKPAASSDRHWHASPSKKFERLLRETGVPIGLLTNGVQLRILISDPARPDSEVVIPLDSAWKRNRDVPDSFEPEDAAVILA